MKEIHIDCSVITSREVLHDTFASTLHFPYWYGRNLDALYDCLTGIGEPVMIYFTCWPTTAEALGTYAHGVQAVFTDAAKANPNLSVRFQEKTER